MMVQFEDGVCYDTNVKTTSELELGVLPTFRLLTGVQLAISALGMMRQGLAPAGSPAEIIPLSLFNLAWPGLLLTYLSIPGLRRMLNSFYLPIAIIWAAAGSISDPYILGNSSPDISAQSLWRQTMLLCIPLVVVSLEYSMRQVILFSVLTLALNTTLLALALGSLDLFSNSLMAIISIQLILFLLIGNLNVRLMKIQREQWRRLTEANTRLAQHATTLEQLAVSQERNRLARELHDTLAHSLSATTIQLEASNLLWEINSAKAHELLQRALETTRNGLTETRRALESLRASPLEDWGLPAALRQLASESAERSGYQLKLALPESLEILPPQIEQTIYRCAQETLSNIARHAEAHNVQCQLTQTNGQVELTITDDGHGFDVNSVDQSKSFGLVGMRERVELLNGRLEITSKPGQGTTVHLTMRAGS